MYRVGLGSNEHPLTSFNLFTCFLSCCLLSLFYCLFPAIAVAQESNTSAPENQQGSTNQESLGSDLAAAAKLAKEQRAQQSVLRTERSQAVDEMAQELALSQEEPIAGAPAGYRYYYFQPGDYAILVPADAKPESRDNYGLHLFSEEAFSMRIELILGDPIEAQGNTPEQILHNANNEYLPGCALSISGVGPAVNGHPSHSMGYENCTFSQYLRGSSELVIGDGFVMPVLCGYPETVEERTPTANPNLKKVLQKYDRERLGFNACNQILPSLKLHPYGDRWKPKEMAPPTKKAVLTAVTASTETPASGEEPSLGALARARKKGPQKAVLSELKSSASEYETFSFRYFCTKERDLCYSANVQLPAAAKRNANFNPGYTGLFQFEIPIGSSEAIIQANTGASSEAGVVTRDQLINTKINWWLSYGPADYYSGVQPATVLTEELTEIAGIPARLATSRSATASGPVITYMVQYMVPGKFVSLRCSVPEKSSGDAQGMCEQVVRSLEFPKQLDEPESVQ
jgi:hypothetical protein